MPLEAPQMVTNSRMLYFTWVPADPSAVRALVPDSLELAENSQCFINQYVVDSADQTSGFDAYSLTYAGADLSGHNTPDGAVPGRWWTHYFNSNADMRDYAAKRGVPAEAGETTKLRPTEPEPQQSLPFGPSMEDAPLCSECGGLMTRNGSCYKCENCGGTSGCS